MQLTLPRETLLGPLQMVISVVERKQTLPILGNVLIQIDGQTFSMTATDLEIELISSTQLDSPLPQAIQFTVPAHKLLDICKALPEQATINLTISETRLLLTSDRSRFTLAILPAHGFPDFEDQQPHTYSTTHTTVEQKKLSALFQRTQFAIAQQDIRYQLNGMLLDIKKDTLRTVATDGHRFAMNTTTFNMPEQTPTSVQAILPRKSVLELARLLKTDTSETINVMMGENHVQFTTDHFKLTSKLIGGKFPHYEHLLPKEAGKTISIDKDTLKDALLRVAVLSNEKFRIVKLKLSANLLEIFADNTNEEAAEESLYTEYTGEPFEVVFNLSYLLDVLNTISNGLMNISFFAPKYRIMVEEQKDGGESIFLIMPLQT
ncbi:MAG: polymerase subunit beta [Gammaproteobacteria bacterium]|nr:polymerase subunit beta [Gammaproteobacteria bacterium]